MSGLKAVGSDFSTVKRWMASIAIIAIGAMTVHAQDEALRDEVSALRKEMEAMRKEHAANAAARVTTTTTGPSVVDRLVDSKAAPAATPVTTKTGKLQIGGLIQTWYYSIDNDNVGFFGSDAADTNETKDNDSFRIRRAELTFTFDVHENIQGKFLLDFAREAQSFPSFPSNLGTANRGRSNGTSGAVTNVQTGAAGAGRTLQDVFIRYHGVVPHHEFFVGQYKPWLGLEAHTSASALDFVERSFIGQLGDFRDLGVTVYGKWFDERLQYWIGAFNGTGNFHGSAGQQQNRTDDNDEKDFTARLAVRPLWKHKTFGSLELGGGIQAGIHGESGNPQPDGADAGTDPDSPVNGLNRRRTNAIRWYAFANYEAGGPVAGWWIRGEYASIKDRNIPASVRGFPQSDAAAVQDSPNPFKVDGFYISTGYNIGKSIFKDSAPKWLRNFEFAARYERFENVTVGDLVDPESRTDVFATEVYTAGINYYIKGNNAKIQLNYNVVDDPDENNNFEERNFRGVNNNSFVVNFQVGF